MRAHSVHLIDPAALRRLRKDRGLSERELAAQLGLASAVTVRQIEGGGDQRHLDLAFVTELARCLVTPVSALLNEPATDPGARTAPAALVARVGAVLYDTRHPVPVELLARTLDCTLTDLEPILTDLASTLPAVGLNLHRFNGSVSLQPTIDENDLALAAKEVIVHRHLRIDRAALL